ncbi:putative RalA-binding protein 1-A [Hypsibius exemplaris]|uniref:RalA-binding protein 1-A n=1 Tax=Hypsibius exemplaris TaxID=2072580 RepID=A0A1W0XEZ2_HYPEX|nr:putative RalA-binding protein 1-A [Hypsibius exemplaris]
MERGGAQEASADAHHGSYGFAKTKKKEKGYKSVGLVSSEDEDDAALMIGNSSGPSSIQSAVKSKSKPAFRLKKKKSFKDMSKGGDHLSHQHHSEKSVDELVERTKVKHKSNTNPFDDRPGGADPKRRSQLARALSKEEPESQIFGIPLQKALQIDKCPDGIEVPAFFRVCVNYIEDNGLDWVGVYRTSGSQSRIQELKRHFNRGDRVRLNDYDVPTVADVMKLFIRELPDRLIPEEILPDLEEAIDLPDLGKRADAVAKVLTRLDSCSRTFLGWIFVHMSHVVERQEQNKMSVRNVALVLEPTLKIQSNKVLNFLLTQAYDVFSDVKITKQGAAPPQNAVTNEALTQLREDLTKKEVMLNHLHHEIKQGKASKRKEEQLWDVQRQVTQLKRKIRTLERMTTVTLQTEDVSLRDGVRPAAMSEQILKPQPVTVTTARLHQTQIPSASDVATVEEKYLGLLNEKKDEILSTAAPAVTEEQHGEMVRELVHQIHLYDALQGHNKHLRDKIRNESDALARTCEEINNLPHQLPVYVDEDSLDKEQLVKEFHELMGKYQANKTMTNELNDAICSETSGWIGVVAELNARKARNCTRGSAV